MSVDILQNKIRKLKNPSVINLWTAPEDIPPFILQEEGSLTAAYVRLSKELSTRLQGIVPAFRLSFSGLSLSGADGLEGLEIISRDLKKKDFYVFLDAPEIYSIQSAEFAADRIWGKNEQFTCDGLILSSYMGSDLIKPFLTFCRDKKKDLFAMVRSGNKSASEIQDLLAGSRVVHMAAADLINRYSQDYCSKCGYSHIGIMASAGSAESLRSLRAKYPKLYMILDGYDYPNGNAKNCSYAFDKLGYGAVACAGESVIGAWKSSVESDGRDYLDHAEAAVMRMKKNLTRYVNIL